MFRSFGLLLVVLVTLLCAGPVCAQEDPTPTLIPLSERIPISAENAGYLTHLATLEDRPIERVFWAQGGTVLVAVESFEIRFYDVNDLAVPPRRIPVEDGVAQVALTPDGATLIVGSGAGPVGLWDVASGEAVMVLEGHESGVRDLAISPDGGLLASAGDGVRVWNLETGAMLTVLEAGEPVRAVRFSPDGTLLGGVRDDGAVYMWEIDYGSCCTYDDE